VDKGIQQQTQGETHGPGNTRFFLLLVCLLAVVILGLATARIAAGASPAGAPTADPGAQLPPMILPGSPSASASGSSSGENAPAPQGDWIVGAKPSPRADRIATRFGALALSRDAGVFAVLRNRADRFAAALDRSGLLLYAEPDVPSLQSGYPGGLLAANQWWLGGIVDVAGTTPPPVTPNSPALGLVEESLDPAHPDLAAASIRNAFSLGPAQDDHGTSIAAIAGSPSEAMDPGDGSAGTGSDGSSTGTGSGGTVGPGTAQPRLVGVWPGMNMALFPSGDTCLTATKAVLDAAASGVSVINMSYGFADTDCFSHFVATETAVSKGILPVAAAGNTFETGNVAMRPATDPHVISVSATDRSGLVAPFATRNDKVDITAPGDAIEAPVVRTLKDGSTDRTWGEVSGTSFSTPMVSAAATWLRQARPDLSARQVGRVLTSSAIDLGDPGRDPSYGEGMLSIDRALAEPAPPDDPAEPNDDIQWVDGSLLGTPSPWLWTPASTRKSSVTATVSLQKDPADVYRVRVAPKRALLITAAQFQGDVVLRAFRPTAKTILSGRKQTLVRTDKSRPATEGVRVLNRKAKAQTVYVAVTPSARQADEYMRYRLSVSNGGRVRR
jgi:hypothetical protein